MKKRRIKKLSKDPRLLPNIHMLSDSCLQPLVHPLIFPSLSAASAGQTEAYHKRRFRHPHIHKSPIAIHSSCHHYKDD